MNVVGLGVDVVDIRRIEGILERRPRFVERVFSPSEIDYCEARQAGRAGCYAARWAAREACVKALGGVRGGWKWHDIRVVRASSGAPVIELHGTARARAVDVGAERVLVSFAHERETAVAFCVAVGR